MPLTDPYNLTNMTASENFLDLITTPGGLNDLSGGWLGFSIWMGLVMIIFIAFAASGKREMIESLIGTAWFGVFFAAILRMLGFVGERTLAASVVLLGISTIFWVLAKRRGG